MSVIEGSAVWLLYSVRRHMSVTEGHRAVVLLLGVF